MSHSYTSFIDYTDEALAVCHQAEENILSVLQECENIRRNSSSLIDADIREILVEIEQSCQAVNTDIENRQSSMAAERQNLLSRSDTSRNNAFTDDSYGSLSPSDVSSAQRRKTTESRELSSLSSDDLRKSRLILHEANHLLLRLTGLQSAVREAFDKKISEDGRPGRNVDALLSSIQDSKLCTMIRILSRNPIYDDFSDDELKTLAESRLDPSKKVPRKFMKELESSLVQQMSAEHLSEETISKVVDPAVSRSPLEMMNAASDEILDERLRKSAVKAIVNAISKKGFVINKSHIRRIKESDVVKITALKPGGQKAEFTIALDGKFMYRFDGYEGLSCEKDIAAMEKDLESVYGIKIRDKVVTWSNPDKLTKTHYTDADVMRGQ